MPELKLNQGFFKVGSCQPILRKMMASPIYCQVNRILRLIRDSKIYSVPCIFLDCKDGCFGLSTKRSSFLRIRFLISGEKPASFSLNIGDTIKFTVHLDPGYGIALFYSLPLTLSHHSDPYLPAVLLFARKVYKTMPGPLV